MAHFAKGDVIWVRGIVVETRQESDELQVSFDDEDLLGKDHYRVGIPIDQARLEDEIVGIDIDLTRYPLPVQAVTASGRMITVLDTVTEDRFLAFDHATGREMLYNRHGVFRNVRPRIDFPDALKRYSASRQERIVAVRNTVDTVPPSPQESTSQVPVKRSKSSSKRS